MRTWMTGCLAIWMVAGVALADDKPVSGGNANPEAIAKINHTPILLWENGAPGALGTEAKDKPAITPYFTDSWATGRTAIVICPGGGYGGLAGHEGQDYALFLNQHGVTCFVLKYRLGSQGYRHPAMLNDVSRAIRTVRTHAQDWGIDPKKIGVMGSSAGGHLASTVMTHFDAGQPNSTDLVEHASSRPDFGILCYPVVTLLEKTHAGSRNNLLGPNPPTNLLTNLSNELQVNWATPPSFVWHTWDDGGVPVENALNFAKACRKEGVRCELHIYAKGPHGIGLGDKPPFQHPHPWTVEMVNWLATNKLIAAETRATPPAVVSTNPVISNNPDPILKQDRKPILLWENGAPDALGKDDKDKPTLTPYFPTTWGSNRTAFVICPGGAYAFLAYDLEGTEPAMFFSRSNIVCFVLKYRICSQGYRYPCILNDVSRAIRMVRARAQEWGVDPNKVGVMGFSAGGHMVSTVMTHFDVGQPASPDPIERQSARPAFGILGYSVISMTNRTHTGMRDSLLGTNASPELLNSLSNESQVTSQTPPCFMFHMLDDWLVCEHTLNFALALREKKVRYDLHLYQTGSHGVGVGAKPPAFNNPHLWTRELFYWMKTEGFL